MQIVERSVPSTIRDTYRILNHYRSGFCFSSLPETANNEYGNTIPQLGRVDGFRKLAGYFVFYEQYKFPLCRLQHGGKKRIS